MYDARYVMENEVSLLCLFNVFLSLLLSPLELSNGAISSARFHSRHKRRVSIATRSEISIKSLSSSHERLSTIPLDEREREWISIVSVIDDGTKNMHMVTEVSFQKREKIKRTLEFSY